MITMIGIGFLILVVYASWKLFLKPSRDAWRDMLDKEDPDVVRKYWPTYKR